MTTDQRNLWQDEGFIRQFLRRVGMQESTALDVFWSSLTASYGKFAKQIGEAAESIQQGGSAARLYELKNRYLNLSLMMSSQFLGPVYLSLMQDIAALDLPQPSSILDLGCENGVLTCFYASLFPESEVIGVDRCAPALSCAKKLAERLELTNLTFIEGDVTKLDEVFGDKTFDFISGVFVWKEAIGFPIEVDTSPTPDADIPPVPHSKQIVLEGLVPYLSSDGIVLSIERCPYLATHVWWARLLNQAGLILDEQRSKMLVCGGPDGRQQKMPFLVTQKGVPGPAPKVEDVYDFVHKVS